MVLTVLKAFQYASVGKYSVNIFYNHRFFSEFKQQQMLYPKMLKNVPSAGLNCADICILLLPTSKWIFFS